MFELVPPNTKFDFIGYRPQAVVLSLVMVAASVLLLFVPGPNLGIDFAGGSLVHLRFTQSHEADDLRSALGRSALEAADIQDLGNQGREFLIRVPLSEEGSDAVSKRVATAMQEAFGTDQVEVLRIEAVGPRVGEALRSKAIWAVLLSTVIMGVYIWARFEWRFGVGTATAIFHDVLIVVGFLIAFGYEFDLNIVAALLTVVGFSVNDKVVVSDRIRESRRKDRRSPLAAIINQSINETLSRTILTNGTAFLAVLSLYLLGGSVLHGFAFSLVVGSIIGTYSSIYIASTIVLYFEPQAATVAVKREQQRAAPAAKRR